MGADVPSTFSVSSPTSPRFCVKESLEDSGEAEEQSGPTSSSLDRSLLSRASAGAQGTLVTRNAGSDSPAHNSETATLASEAAVSVTCNRTFTKPPVSMTEYSTTLTGQWGRPGDSPVSVARLHYLRWEITQASPTRHLLIIFKMEEITEVPTVCPTFPYKYSASPTCSPGHPLAHPHSFPRALSLPASTWGALLSHLNSKEFQPYSKVAGKFEIPERPEDDLCFLNLSLLLHTCCQCSCLSSQRLSGCFR